MIAIARRAWLMIPGVPQPVAPGFAPPAWRPAPGAESLGPLANASAVQSSRQSAHMPTLARFLTAASIGALAYVVAVAVLIGSHAAESLPGRTGSWVLRDVLLAVFICAALASGSRIGPGRVSPDRAMLSTALCGVGVTTWLLGVLDMHLFGLFEIANGALSWDMVFHGVGPACVAAGILLRRPPSTKRASEMSDAN